MRFTLLLLSIISGLNLVAQRLDLDLFGGISNYQGDLQPLFFTQKNAGPGAAVIAKYGVTENIFIRAGFSFGSMAGDDKDNKDDLQRRNLRFKSGIQEFSAGLEYRLIKPESFAFTPYAFAGVGVFRFNPYAEDAQGQRIYLQPLSTEGQGVPGYPDRKVYSLTQICIPYGVGIKWQLTCNFNLGFEFRHTKTFTDYIDDVSTTYIDEDALRNARGQLAVDYAWRRDEFDGRPYPQEGAGRGNPANKDWYYFAGVTVGLKLNDCETGGFTLGGLIKPKGGSSNGRPQNSKKARRQVDCPKVW